MEKRGELFLLFVLIILSTTCVFASEIEDSLHLNIQTTDALGDVINGTFDFTFLISNSNNCDPVLYLRLVTLTTDSRGIISYYLNNTKLNYSEQYWLCYYRDGDLIETSKIVRTPYTFSSKNTTLGGTVIDVNLNMGNYNITTTGTGFFGFLGSLVNRITSLFVQDADISNNLNVGNNINVTGNVTASYFIGDGSLLTGISSEENVSWNETYANNIYAPKNYGDNWNKTYADTLYSNIQWNYNQTIETFNLYNSIWSSTYNSTYASYLFGLRNETLDTFNNYNSTWDNRGLIASINTTANIQNLINGTNANFANVEFNGGWTNGGASIINGNIFARAAYFYNITGLDTTTLKINGSLLPTTGWDDTFDIGSSSLRWKNLYLSGDARINGTIYYGNEGIPITALNETGLINSVNTTANVQTLLAGTNISQYAFNQTLETFNTYNSTWDNNWVNQFAYNHTIDTFNLHNAPWSTTYNSTYAGYGTYAFNQTTLVGVQSLLNGSNSWFNSLGVGTATPAYNLVVQSNGDLQTPTLLINDSSATRNNAQLRFGGASGNLWAIGTDVSTDNGQTNFEIYDLTGTLATRLTIQNTTGNVGIGTTSPSVYAGLTIGSSSSSGSNHAIAFSDGSTLKSLIGSVGTAGAYASTSTIDDLVIRNVITNKDIIFATDGGDDRLHINGSSGNVGIGTDSPDTKLTINGNIHLLETSSSDTSITLDGTNAYGDTSSIYLSAGRSKIVSNVTSGANGDTDLTFSNYYGGVSYPRFRISEIGNVGIGTTSPNARLSISDTTSTTNQLEIIGINSPIKTHLGTFAGETYFANNYYYNDGHLSDNISFSSSEMVMAPGYIQFNNMPAGSPGTRTTTLFLNLSTGNVGIGTTNPIYALHLSTSADTGEILSVNNNNTTGTSASSQIYAYAGNAQFAIQSHGDARVISRFGITLGGYTELRQVAGNGLIIGTSVASPIILGTNGVEVARILSGGNVGIGTTSPTSSYTGANTMVHIKGNVGGNAGILKVQSYGSVYSNELEVYAADGVQNVGLYSKTNSSMTFWTNNSERVTIGNTGNVGIGTTSPTQTKLVVNGAISVVPQVAGSVATPGEQVALQFNDQSGATTWASINFLNSWQNDNGEWMNFNVRNGAAAKVTAMTLDKDGNVGIGTASPSQKLQVGSGSSYTTSITGMDIRVSGTGNKWIGAESNGATAYFGVVPGGNYVKFDGYNYSNDLYLNVVLASNGGNVGIGTTSPRAKLEINDTSVVTGDRLIVGSSVDNEGEYTGIKLQNGGVDLGAIRTSWLGGTNPNSRLGFYVGDNQGNTLSEKLSILANGNIGIGTTNPIRFMHIANGELVIEQTAGLADWKKWNFYVGGGAGNAQSLYLRILNDAGTASSIDVMRWDSSGNTHVIGSIDYVGTITDVSDIRLKNNILNLTNSLNKLSNLQGIKFNMNNSNVTEFGFSAQEVQKIFPELVSITDKENGYLGVSYIGFIPVMTESIKELKTENEMLKEENGEQQIQIEELKNENEELQSTVNELRLELCTKDNYSWC